MLDLMLAASDDPSAPESKKLSDTEVLAQSIIFLAAGYETSSGTLSLTCHHIATNPEVQDKLQQEIDSVWTDEEQTPSYEALNEMPYLDMVISETLRLYPPGRVGEVGGGGGLDYVVISTAWTLGPWTFLA